MADKNKSQVSKLAILLRGIITENPVLILVLGTCPTLAVTGKVISALSMGLAATIVLVCSNSVISLLRNIIPDTVRIPCYIVVIAGFVTAVQMLLNAYLPDIYDMLGVYLALIVVNCIILGRAEMFARKNPVLHSALDGLGMGLGFLLALLMMSVIREVLGTATIFAFGDFEGIHLPLIEYIKLPILTQAPGGFLVFGILIATMNFITRKKGGIKRKSFDCESCPTAHMCSRAGCCGEQTPAAETATEGGNENDGN